MRKKVYKITKEVIKHFDAWDEDPYRIYDLMLNKTLDNLKRVGIEITDDEFSYVKVMIHFDSGLYAHEVTEHEEFIWNPYSEDEELEHEDN